jgi:hypothetical protein
MSKRKRPNKIGAYIPVIKAIIKTPAWRAMSPGARLLWIELRGWLRNDWSNNGRIFLSDRDAAEALGTKSTRSIVRWFAENEHYGFLHKTRGGFLGSDGHGLAAHYRFTDLPYGTRSPTRDYEKWDGELFRDPQSQPGPSQRKKQNPVTRRGTPRDPQGHIRKVGNGGSVCDPQGHIGKAPRCDPQGHITSLPLPKAREERKQGSSTARAPVKAGGAGSSPAPVASTEYVQPAEPDGAGVGNGGEALT